MAASPDKGASLGVEKVTPITPLPVFRARLVHLCTEMVAADTEAMAEAEEGAAEVVAHPGAEAGALSLGIARRLCMHRQGAPPDIVGLGGRPLVFRAKVYPHGNCK